MKKEDVLRRLKEAGFELDLRQAQRSFVFATFSGTDIGANHQKLQTILTNLKTFFIEKTKRVKFTSSLKQITLCPIISSLSLGPKIDGLKLSHRPSEMHVFVSLHVSPDVWKTFTPKVARIYLIDQLNVAIDQIRASWLNAVDRAKLKQIFASFVEPKKVRAVVDARKK